MVHKLLREANGQCKQVDMQLREGNVLGFLFYSLEGGA